MLAADTDFILMMIILARYNTEFTVVCSGAADRPSIQQIAAAQKRNVRSVRKLAWMHYRHTTQPIAVHGLSRRTLAVHGDRCGPLTSRGEERTPPRLTAAQQLTSEW